MQRRDTYATRLKAHLGEHKRDTLGIQADGVWVRNGKQYPHILPTAKKWLNVLEPIRDEFQEYLKDKQPDLKLHRDFHHLNSSQAMAFNLFFPWFGFGHAEPFLRALGVTPGPIAEWRFEHIPDPDEFTNLDFWVRFSDARELHVEVKLTEAHFGSAKANPEHLAKLQSTYRARLRGKIDPTVPDATLLKHYQLMRIVSGLTLSRGDEAIVIAPGAHSALQKEFAAFAKLLEPAARDRIRMVELDDDLCEALTAASFGRTPAEETTSLFARKYLIQS